MQVHIQKLYYQRYEIYICLDSYYASIKKNRTPLFGVRSFYSLTDQTSYYSAAASVAGASAGASTGASALGAAFLPARRVVFLAAALGVFSMFSL